MRGSISYKNRRTICQTHSNGKPFLPSKHRRLKHIHTMDLFARLDSFRDPHILHNIYIYSSHKYVNFLLHGFSLFCVWAAGPWAEMLVEMFDKVRQIISLSRSIIRLISGI